ncbi:MAG: D-aminoacyl-tRNA deacylase [Pirellulales bacterium]
MRACVQRVVEAHVSVGPTEVGRIGAGLVVLLGIARDDTIDDVRYMAEKIAGLRIFEDDRGRMHRSVEETGGGLLIVSQFTLLGDCRKGRRPSFVAAADPDDAQRLYETFVDHIRQRGITTATGQFRQMMRVALVNDGPVTLLIDSRRKF